MRYIGIVIFTIFTKTTVYVGDCVGGTMNGLCADVVTTRMQEFGRPIPQYVGEFDTDDACRKAAQTASYRGLKTGERIGDTTEVICVPKTNAVPPNQ